MISFHLRYQSASSISWEEVNPHQCFHQFQKYIVNDIHLHMSHSCFLSTFLITDKVSKTLQLFCSRFAGIFHAIIRGFLRVICILCATFILTSRTLVISEVCDISSDMSIFNLFSLGILNSPQHLINVSQQHQSKCLKNNGNFYIPFCFLKMQGYNLCEEQTNDQQNTFMNLVFREGIMTAPIVSTNCYFLMIQTLNYCDMTTSQT